MFGSPDTQCPGNRTPVEILADTRRLLRGTSDPIPDPLPAARARRRATDALVSVDAGEHVWFGGLGIRRDGDGYRAGPLDPMTRDELFDVLVDLAGR